MSRNCSHLFCFQFYYISLHVLYCARCVSGKISVSALSWNQPKTLKMPMFTGMCALGWWVDRFMKGSIGSSSEWRAGTSRGLTWSAVVTGQGLGLCRSPPPLHCSPATALNPPSLLPHPVTSRPTSRQGAWPEVAGFSRGRKLGSGWRGPTLRGCCAQQIWTPTLKKKRKKKKKKKSILYRWGFFSPDKIYQNYFFQCHVPVERAGPRLCNSGWRGKIHVENTPGELSPLWQLKEKW